MILGQTQLIVHFRALERIRHRLREAAVLGHVLKSLLHAQVQGQAAHRRRTLRESRRDVIISVHPRDFLGDVRLRLEILAERRGDHLAGLVVDFQFQPAEIFTHIRLGNIRAQEGIDPVGTERNALRYGKLFLHIDHAPDDFAAAEQLDQLAGAVHGLLAVIRVKALLILRGRIRAQTQTLRSQTVIRAVEAGALEQDLRDVVRDLRVFAAHDAGQADLSLGVADHQHVVIERVHLSVERLELVAVFRALHDDLPARDLIHVERVHRLTVLIQDEVRDIH